MRFKQWLIKEMAYITLPKELRINGMVIDAIDMRFEDYPKNTEEEKNLIRRVAMPLRTEPYFARFPKSERYLIFDGKRYKVSVAPPIDWEDWIEIPDSFDNGYSWWDYAAGYFKNKIVKMPLRLRMQHDR